MKLAWMLVGLALCALGQEQVEGWGRLPQGEGYFRGKPVKFQVWEGQAVVEGDILLGPVEELVEVKGGEREAVLIAAERFRWPEGVVVYELDAAIPNSARVTQSIEHWEARTGIRFRVRTDEADYVRIQRAAAAGTCNSNIGRIGGRQTINLGDACSLGNTIHEIGHTIGLFHTQARGDRNGSLRVRYENIDKTQWSQYDQVLATAVDSGPYDFGSIMHYSVTGFTRNTRNAFDTIPAGIPVGQRSGLSPGDVLAVQQAYGVGVKGVTIATVPAGLQVEVDGTVVTTPRTYDWADGEKHTVRAVDGYAGTEYTRLQFGRWSDGGEIGHTVEVGPQTRLLLASYSQQVLLKTGVTPAGGGTLQLEPESPDGFYPYGTVVRVTAAPGDGNKFLEWQPGPGGATALAANGQGPGAAETYVNLILTPMYYVGRFVSEATAVTRVTTEPAGVPVTVDGVTSYSPRNFIWAEGTTHNVTVPETQILVSTASRVRFVEWSNGGERAQTVTADAGGGVLTAKLRLQYEFFRSLDWVRLTSAAQPSLANFRLEPAPEGGYYDAGQEVQLIAEGPEGVPFAHWYGDAGGSESPLTLKIREQTVVTANFLSPTTFGVRSVVNQASRQPGPLAPGGVYVVYSPEIGPGEVAAGYAVLLGETNLKILAVEKNTLTFQMPEAVTGATGVLTVRTPRATRTQPMTLLPVSLGMYTATGTGLGQVKARNGGGGDNGAERPAARGSVVQVVVTGAGAATEFQVEFGDVLGEVLGVSKLEAPGQVALEVVVPQGSPVGPEVPLVVRSGGATTQLGVTIAIE